MNHTKTNLTDAPLGKTSSYSSTYSPALLFPIPRKYKREEMDISLPLPFDGVDIWNAYEVSWLNPKGRPIIAMAEFSFPCQSTYIIESKSFKLYLNSFNQTRFASADEVKKTLIKDLSEASGVPVGVHLIFPASFSSIVLREPLGICLDELDIDISTYHLEPQFLKKGKVLVEEVLYSNLLRSNCLVTGQPDWGTVQIHYYGPKINQESLLRYIVSFREHQEFHEQCVERIFMDVLRHCRPQKLSVYAQYTRRGGLDINPFRSNFSAHPKRGRTARQ
jgi:7-cyano-7-deazaguanine reductase